VVGTLDMGAGADETFWFGNQSVIKLRKTVTDDREDGKACLHGSGHEVATVQ
jgi:hypothetical protein